MDDYYILVLQKAKIIERVLDLMSIRRVLYPQNHSLSC